MELDRISTALRPRSRWEALDLGIVMARAWWWPLCRAWLAVTLPALLLLHLLLFNYPVLAITIFWWLKPMWERAVLHILSRALFGELPPLRETLRAFPKLAAKQWFASLTYRRFSLTRSMDLPVVQLEGLKGKQRSQRLKTLHGKQGSGAAWLTFVGAHIEMLLPLAALLLFIMLLPDEVEFDWSLLFGSEPSYGFELFTNLLWYGVMTLVAPFYVAGGFSLYINRRTWLEGWDIELSFRRLLQRVQNNGLAKVAAVLLALLLSVLSPDPTMAAEQSLNRVQAKADIEEIMSGEAFHDMETRRSLDWGREDEEDKTFELPDWVGRLIAFIADNVRGAIWAVMVALPLLYLFKYREWLAQQAWRLRRAPNANEPLPTVLFGMEVGSETLPQDVSSQVAQLWQAQQHRAAYALLYRASLSRLMEFYQLRFHSGHTEDECCRLVQQQTGSALGHYFAELTLHWQRLAYAHQLPADEVMRSLCQRWPQHFEEVALNE